jgi:hypothetical protein
MRKDNETKKICCIVPNNIDGIPLRWTSALWQSETIWTIEDR